MLEEFNDGPVNGTRPDTKMRIVKISECELVQRKTLIKRVKGAGIKSQSRRTLRKILTWEFGFLIKSGFGRSSLTAQSTLYTTHHSNHEASLEKKEGKKKKNTHE